MSAAEAFVRELVKRPASHFDRGHRSHVARDAVELIAELDRERDADELEHGYEVACRLTALGWRRTFANGVWVWSLPEHGDPENPTGGYWTQYGTNPRNGLPGVPMSMPVKAILEGRL